ncbi:glycosyltransferase family 39 protein [Streptomyces sp. NPDC052496]|uniref:ArnT family glycosyltransferase n=1 Tax=Streptomyces sp. NPDC052496 TaxID=3154951 RepID=UPI0034122C96
MSASSASTPPTPAAAAPARPSPLAPAPRRARRRWELWRSPEDQPLWARPALLGIAAAAALLYAWNITTSGLAPYYSVAARSMTESWKAFLFTAYDPSATITLDKIGGFLWPQALSARLFGFHDWALTLPQCLEGVITVLVLHRVVRRWQGPATALLAATLFTLTPVTASLFGHAIPDAALIMCLVLAADQGQRAAQSGRSGPLLLAGVWVGLGFQAKMMQAWLIVPALTLAYLVTAPVPFRKRLGHVLTAGAVMAAVSLSWVLMMTFTPKDVRPYVDGTTDNSAFSMVFGYNGFSRLGQTESATARTGAAAGGAPGTRTGDNHDAKTGNSGGAKPSGTSGAKNRTRTISGSDTGNVAWYKLLSTRLTAQIGWLYPLAAIGLVLGLLRCRKRPRTDRTRAGYLLWGTWLVATAAVLSFTPVPHTAYVAALAPSLAALSAAGTVALWRARLTGHSSSRYARAALPAVIALQAAWAVFLALRHPDFVPWLTPLVAAAALLGIVALSRERRARRLSVVGLAAGCLALFAAPATWSLSVLDTRYAGSAFDAHAGPDGPGSFSHVALSDGPPQRSTPDSSRQDLSPAERRLLDYARQHSGPAEYILSSGPGWARARGVLATGLPVLPLGGASGRVPSVTLAAYRHLVASGALRFALLDVPGGSSRGGADDGAATSENEKIDAWVRAHCTRVDPREYGGEPAASSSSTASEGRSASGPGSLYDCSSQAS